MEASSNGSCFLSPLCQGTKSQMSEGPEALEGGRKASFIGQLFRAAERSGIFWVPQFPHSFDLLEFTSWEPRVPEMKRTIWFLVSRRTWKLHKMGNDLIHSSLGKCPEWACSPALPGLCLVHSSAWDVFAPFSICHPAVRTFEKASHHLPGRVKPFPYAEPLGPVYLLAELCYAIPQCSIYPMLCAKPYDRC